MKKKLTALFLALVMCMSMSVPAFAIDITATDAAEQEAVIQAEIESEKARIFKDVYEQLVEQNATGLMDTYIEILIPKIEANVRARYGDDTVIPLEDESYRFTNGGTIGYTTSLGATVLDTYMTVSQFSTYICKEITEDVVLSAVEFKLEPLMIAYNVSLGVWGSIFNVLSGMEFVATVSGLIDVRNADGYGNVIEVSTATEYAATIIGWDKYPVAPNPPSGSTDIHVATFPKS